MPAVLVPLPARAQQPTSEPTRFFPREGRTPPVRLQLVPSSIPEPVEESTVCINRVSWRKILEARGEAPAPKSTRKASPASVAPWNRKGFVYPEPTDSQGKRARSIASCREGMDTIRPCPSALVKLLNTPEWKGSTVTEPTALELEGLKKSATAALFHAQALVHAAKGKANKARAASHVAAHESRLARLHEARRVVHPSGAVLLWHPL